MKFRYLNYTHILILATILLFSPSRVLAETPDYPQIKGGVCTKIHAETTSKQDGFALIIGNGAYNPSIGWLENPANDAAAIAGMSLQLGFDVYILTEGDADEIRKCVSMVENDQSEVAVGILYYSGHGLQIENSNYLLPVDATDQSGAMEFQPIIEILQSKALTTIVLFDACRTNPITGSVGLGIGLENSISASPTMDSALTQTAFMFATQPGNVAAEGSGQFSPFTEGILQHFGAEGKTLQENLVSVTKYVGEQTSWMQVPFTRSNLSKLVFLNGQTSEEGIKQNADAFAQRAREALDIGNIDEARVLALSGIPEGASEVELSTIFKQNLEFLRLIDYLHFAKIDTDANSELFNAVFSPDGKRVLTAHPTEEYRVMKITLWDAETGNLLWETQFSHFRDFIYDTGKTVVFSPNSKVFFVRDDNWSVSLRSAEDGEVISKISLQRSSKTRDEPPSIYNISFSPLGDKLVMDYYVGVDGHYSHDIVYSVTTGKMLHHLNLERFRKASQLSTGQLKFGIKFFSQDRVCFAILRDRSQYGLGVPDLIIGVADLELENIRIVRTYSRTDWNYGDAIECNEEQAVLLLHVSKYVGENGDQKRFSVLLQLDDRNEKIISEIERPTMAFNGLVTTSESAFLIDNSPLSDNPELIDINSGEVVLTFDAPEFGGTGVLFRKNGDALWDDGEYYDTSQYALTLLVPSIEIVQRSIRNLTSRELTFVMESRLAVH